MHRIITQLCTHPFGVMLALVGISTSMGYFFDPSSLSRSAMGHTLGTWAIAWNVMYLVAGCIKLFGVLTRRPYVELAGVLLFAGAVTINIVTVIDVIGAAGRYSSIGNLVIIVMALTLRAGLLLTRRDTVLVQEKKA